MRFLTCFILLGCLAFPLLGQEPLVDGKYKLIATIDTRETGYAGPLNIIASPDKKHLLVPESNKTLVLKIYDMSTGELIKTIPIERKTAFINHGFTDENTVYFKFRKKITKVEINSGQVTYGKIKDFKNENIDEINFQFDNQEFSFKEEQIYEITVPEVFVIRELNGKSYLYYNLNE